MRFLFNKKVTVIQFRKVIMVVRTLTKSKMIVVGKMVIRHEVEKTIIIVKPLL